MIGKLTPEAASAPQHPFAQGLKEPGFSSDGKAETSYSQNQNVATIYYNTKIQKKREKSIKGKSIWGPGPEETRYKPVGVSSQSRCTELVQL